MRPTRQRHFARNYAVGISVMLLIMLVRGYLRDGTLTGLTLGDGLVFILSATVVYAVVQRVFFGPLPPALPPRDEPRDEAE